MTCKYLKGSFGQMYFVTAKMLALFPHVFGTYILSGTYFVNTFSSYRYTVACKGNIGLLLVNGVHQRANVSENDYT